MRGGGACGGSDDGGEETEKCRCNVDGRVEGLLVG